MAQGYFRIAERNVRLGFYCGLMVTGMIATPPCAECGSPSTRIELVAPGEFPADWEQWPGTVRGTFLPHREPGQWYLIFKGIATCNGYGNTIETSRAERIARAFQPPCPSPRSTPPGSTTTRASAQTAMLPTATSTGTCPSPVMATAPADTARASTHTGSFAPSIATASKYSSNFWCQSQDLRPRR